MQANPTAPSCEATEKFFDDSFPNCTQRENPAFVEMKKCFVKFVGNAAQLNCDAATDAAATEAPAAAAPAAVSGETRHLLAAITAARELQATPPPTAAATAVATPSNTLAGPTPVERAFLQECGQQIQGCGAAPECRACVTNAVKVSSHCFFK
jgi:phage-related tail fiber protein